MSLDDQVSHESLLIPRGRAALLLFWSLSSSWSFYFYFYVHFIAVVQKILQLKLVLEYLLQILDVPCGCLRGINQHQQQKLEDNEVLNTLFRNVSQYRVEYFVSQLVTVPFQFCPRYVGPILKPICELTMHSSPFRWCAIVAETGHGLVI